MEIKWKDTKFTSPTGVADSMAGKANEQFRPMTNKRQDLELVGL